jgi:predicted transcriptional regulator
MSNIKYKVIAKLNIRDALLTYLKDSPRGTYVAAIRLAVGCSSFKVDKELKKLVAEGLIKTEVCNHSRIYWLTGNKLAPLLNKIKEEGVTTQGYRLKRADKFFITKEE